MVETPQCRRRELRYLVVSAIVLASLLLVQIAGGLVREAVSDEPSARERVETCLTERHTPFETVVGDPVALSAERGALRTTVEGNGVTIALGGSERDARRLYDAYVSVAPTGAAGTTLDLHRRVVFLWDGPPTESQRAFVYLCTLDVQD